MRRIGFYFCNSYQDVLFSSESTVWIMDRTKENVRSSTKRKGPRQQLAPRATRAHKTKPAEYGISSRIFFASEPSYCAKLPSCRNLLSYLLAKKPFVRLVREIAQGNRWLAVNTQCQQCSASFNRIKMQNFVPSMRSA